MSMKKLIAGVITQTRETVKANNLGSRKEVTDFAFSAEGLEDSVRKSAEITSGSLREAVDSAMALVLGSEDFKSAKLTFAQKDAASKIAAIAINPISAIGYMKNLKQGTGIIISAEAMGIDDALDSETLSIEGFDGQAISNALYFSIAFNLGAARQDAFGEAFFPTITMDPTQSGITVDTEFTSLYTDFDRSIAGTPDAKKFNKKPLVKAIFDESIFGTERNKVIPVLRDENKALLLETEQYTDTKTGVDIVSAPLLFGKTIGLLGLSQTDAMLAKGMFDSTDALDRTIKLEKVYYSLTGKNQQNETVTETFRTDVSILPGSNFIYSVQDHFKAMSLSFSSEGFVISTSETRTSKAATSGILAALPSDHIIKLGVKIHGEANTQAGDVSVYASNVEVVEIRNAAGDVIAPSSAEYVAIAAVLSTVKLSGYTLEAYRTNSNLRTRGQLATSDKYSQTYNVPLRSGNTMLFPVNNTGHVDNDAIKLAGQVQVANMKCSVAAVRTLLDTASTLKSVTMNGLDSSVEILGIGRWHVSTYYKENSIDISNFIDSIKSSERLVDIKAALVNKIREEVLVAYIASNYNVAFEAADGSMGAKPTVIIGTDVKIRQYLANGDGTVSLGDEFETVVVSTQNPAMAGKIFITFGVFGENRNSSVNPLNFGNMVWRPTITTDINRSNGSAVVRELHNVPSFLHFVNLPILSVLNVTGIGSAIGKVALNFRTV